MRNVVSNIFESKIFYFILACLLTTLAIIAAFNKDFDPWPIVVMTTFFFGLIHIDKFQKIQVSSSGLTAEFREAKKEAQHLIETLRDATIDITGLSLELIQRSGRLGGFDDATQQEILENSVNRMKEAGAGQEMVDDILYRRWHRYVMFDYVLSILGGNIIPRFSHPPPYDQNDQEDRERADSFQKLVQAERRALIGKVDDDPESPDDIEAIIQKVGDDNFDRRKLLDAYRYYIENKKHQNRELWIKRAEIPPLEIKRISDKD